MTAEHVLSHLEHLRAQLGERLGLCIDDARLPSLAEVLQRRAAARGQSTERYTAALEGMGRAELRELAREVTVGETYFFRHYAQFRAFRELALPERLAAAGGMRPVRILSAGCSSGEEAFSLAILLREAGGDAGNALVRAVDVNPAALERAARGRWSAWSLRETPAPLRQRWFTQEGNEFVLDASIRDAVTFEERNLAADDPDLWRPSSYDVVFCRNVVMYFHPDAARALVARIARALMPGGFLFLGHAEPLRGLSDAFHLRHTHEAFYYQSHQTHEHAPHAPAAAAWPRALSSAAELPPTAWVDTVQRAAARIRELHDRHDGAPRPAPAPGPAATPRTPERHVAAARELFAAERFSDALAALGNGDEAPTTDALLLQAALLTHAGRVGEAERACEHLLQLDELNACAHYLLALCREAAGDAAAAAEHDRIALHLDPTFPMPHLHLGLMARRANDRGTAQRELASAVSLLPAEDPARLSLFGGGFGRESLIILCRAELTSLAADANPPAPRGSR